MYELLTPWQAIYDEVIKQAGCKSEANALECLRKTDDAVLRRINADIAISAYSDVYIFMPVIDHTFVQQAPTQAIAQGKVNGVRDQHTCRRVHVLTLRTETPLVGEQRGRGEDVHQHNPPRWRFLQRGRMASQYVAAAHGR